VKFSEIHVNVKWRVKNELRIEFLNRLGGKF